MAEMEQAHLDPRACDNIQTEGKDKDTIVDHTIQN